MKKLSILLLAAFLISIAGNVYSYRLLKSPKEISSLKAEKSTKANSQAAPFPRKKRAVQNNEELKNLRDKVKMLQNELNTQVELNTAFKQSKVDDFPENDLDSELAKADFEENLENLKEDPEEYKKLIDTLKGLRKNDKVVADYFKKLDTSILSAEEQKLYEEYIKKMEEIDKLKLKAAETSDLMEKMQCTQQIVEEMMQTKGLKAARKVAMNSMATELGYKGDDINKFVDYVDYIYKNTSAAAVIDDIIGNGTDLFGQGASGHSVDANISIVPE